jgi:RHS repeat-associated protein
MLSPFAPWSADECIRAFDSQGKKPHQGIAPQKTALHQGLAWSNSTVALGLRSLAVENHVRSRCTGKERDTETGNDYFGARYYTSNMGRFLTPDWAARPTAVLYAVYGDPQSLNLYVYVRNDPISRLDPDGHFDCTGANASGIGCAVQTAMHNFFFGPPPPPPPAPPAPTAPPVAKLKTDIKANTTTFTVGDKNGVHETTIETHVVTTHDSKPDAGGPIHSVVKGVDNKHAGSKEYGPKGALIDAGDSRNRYIHGGGSRFGVVGSQADRQGWAPTYGCTRGQNIDVINLGKEITSFQQSHPESPISYDRE